MDVQQSWAFISANKYSNIKNAIFPPLGLLYIASSLEEEGHSVEVISYYYEINSDIFFPVSIIYINISQLMHLK